MSDKNIVWHSTTVKRADREALLKQKGIVLWFTGLSGSGKSTVANAVAQQLHLLGRLTFVLDGDNVRHGLNQDLGFSLADRAENLRRIGEVAKLFVETGVIILATFISPLIKERRNLRNLLGGDFVEVYVDCALAHCEARDPKKLYQKARAGEIKEFTGISSPYEPPENAEIHLHTDRASVDECVRQVIDYLSKQFSVVL